MPCTGINESPGPRIEAYEKHRDKTVRVGLVDKDQVGTAEDFFDFRASRRERVQMRVSRSHQDGRADPVSGDVGNDYAEAVIGHGEEVEVVSGGKLGRIHGPGNVEPRQRRRMVGQKVLLDLLRRDELREVLSCTLFRPSCARSSRRISRHRYNMPCSVPMGLKAISTGNCCRPCASRLDWGVRPSFANGVSWHSAARSSDADRAYPMRNERFNRLPEHAPRAE